MGDAFTKARQTAVRQALAELLERNEFRRSPRLAQFLRYVVEARLAGRAEAIKAYAIAVDVFGRSESFDPQADPIVRVQARRLRHLLDAYHKRHTPASGVRITLPVGSYVPVFTAVSPGSSESEPGAPPPAGPDARAPHDKDPVASGRSRRGRAVPILASVLAFLILVGVLAWPALVERSQVALAVDQPLAPLVIVEEFENLTDDRIGSPLVAGLALELVTSLNSFPDMVSRYGGARVNLLDDENVSVRPIFVLSGVVRRVGTDVQYDAILTDVAEDSIVAAFDISVPVEGRQPTTSLTEIARMMVLGIASPRGEPHAGAREWLESSESEGKTLRHYPCLVQFALYRDRPSSANRTRTEDCALELAQQARSEPYAQAMLSRISADRAWHEGVGTLGGRAALDLARRRAELARDLLPLDAFVWAQLAWVSLVSGDVGQARDQLNSAYQLNPANIDILAAVARTESRLGNWSLALALSERAFSAEPQPPDWFYGVPALHALRTGDYGAAHRYGARLANAEPELGVTIVLAAAGMRRDISTVNAWLPRLFAIDSFRRMGVLPTLRLNVRDPDMLRVISNGVSHAGVPLDRLVSPF